MQHQLFMINSYVNMKMMKISPTPTNLGRSHFKLLDASPADLVVIKEKLYRAESMLLQSSTKQINNSQFLNTSLNNLEYVIRGWLKTSSSREFSFILFIIKIEYLSKCEILVDKTIWSWLPLIFKRNLIQSVLSIFSYKIVDNFYIGSCLEFIDFKWLILRMYFRLEVLG